MNGTKYVRPFFRLRNQNWSRNWLAILLPKIDLSQSDSTLPFSFTRRQIFYKFWYDNKQSTGSNIE